MIYAYRAYGLILHLCFPCPALVPADASEPPDVVMVEGVVPLDSSVADETRWLAEAGWFLWRGGRRAGRFLVENGRRVTLELSPTAEDEALAFHFVRSALPAVLRQRGLVVLHASAATTPSGAVAVGGRSGAGKSTTLAALMARGCPLLSDDVTALCAVPVLSTSLSRLGGALVLPGVPQLYLCEEATLGLQQDASGLPFRAFGRLKRAMRPAQEMPQQAVPLRAIYLLQTAAGPNLNVHPLSGAARFDALQECLYGPLLPAEHREQFSLFAAVAEQVAIYRIERPADRWTVDEIVTEIIG
jgi:hypothetical protein